MATIFKTKSRYVKAPTNTTGSIAIEALRKQRNPRSYSTIIVGEGETFDSLAFKYFRDPEQYWEIADINPHVSFPDRIPAGTPIRIPER